MKHLKKFNENKNELDKEVLVNFFAYTFDSIIRLLIRP